MGRELFDFAFKEYARRWAFKHPEPADFFRTMEDASAIDLDWFWRGWFYNTDPCEISLDSVVYSKFDGQVVEQQRRPIISRAEPPMGINDFEDISKIRNRTDTSIHFATDKDTSLRDFYWYYSRGLVKVDTTSETLPPALSVLPTQQEITEAASQHVYELYLSNNGGLVMPVILQYNYTDGTSEIARYDAQVWRKNEEKIMLRAILKKEVRSIQLDPYMETSDINTANNTWNGTGAPSKFSLYKESRRQRGANNRNNPCLLYTSPSPRD